MANSTPSGSLLSKLPNETFFNIVRHASTLRSQIFDADRRDFFFALIPITKEIRLRRRRNIVMRARRYSGRERHGNGIFWTNLQDQWSSSVKGVLGMTPGSDGFASPEQKTSTGSTTRISSDSASSPNQIRWTVVSDP